MGSTRKAVRAKAKRRPAARTMNKRAPTVKTAVPKVASKQAMLSAAAAVADASGVVSVSHEPLQPPTVQEPKGAEGVESDEDHDLHGGEPV